MAATNNGTLIYTQLVQMSTKTGQPTGVVAPNVPSNVNYIAPVTDTVTCPLP